jgi:hypothetical protein
LFANLVQPGSQFFEPRQRLGASKPPGLIVATAEGQLSGQAMIRRFGGLQRLERLLVGLLPPRPLRPPFIRAGHGSSRAKTRAATTGGPVAFDDVDYFSAKQ